MLKQLTLRDDVTMPEMGGGVEFTEEPSERPYGIDAAFRDPSGNQIRMVQAT